MKRHVWLSTGGDPPVCAALLSRFLPGAPAESASSAGEGGLLGPLPDGALLRPAPPPPSLPAAQVQLGRMWIDGVVWDGARLEPSSTLLGLFGTVGLDVGLTSRIAFHSHLVLELNRSTYGDLENELARADGEISSRLDHDLRTALALAIGVSFAL